MDMHYQDYCLADRFFYDAPWHSAALGGRFGEDHELPAGWQVHDQAVWTMLAPRAAVLPQQGWKIHVSACLDNAAAVLDVVSEYCLAHRIAFKYLTSRVNFLLRNAKYANRSGSGKFVTVYPAGGAEFERAVADLSDRLAGQPGPYILSDIRIGDGPVHVRYGGFGERFCLSAIGERVPAIEDPAGVLVPDTRQPVFRLPGWAEVPRAVAPHLAARESGGGQALPYTVRQALHFTNGGGVYEATEPGSGLRVVLREARPHAGLDGAGRDAVYRLRHERDVLELLAGLPVIPRLYNYFTCWEHEFIAEEFVEGQTLGKEMAARFPLVHPAVGRETIAGYTAWALGTLERVRQAVDLIHGRGVTFGDLHPHNIIVRPGGEVCLVDFEAASLPAEPGKVIMAAPGYIPPDSRSGPAFDDYALACLAIALFMPLTPLVALDTAKGDMYLDAIAARFPLPPGYCARVREALALSGHDAGHAAERRQVARLAGRIDAGEPAGAELMASAARAIRASATPRRQDRLFPGDVKQFPHGGLGIAYGAAGVLYALQVTGYGVRPEEERWLADSAWRARNDLPCGFYDGLHGVAHVLDMLGRRDAALNLLDHFAGRDLAGVPLSLSGGLAGIGLNLLHFAERTGQRGLRDAALNVADRLSAASAALPYGDRGSERKPRAGLMHGAAGRALFFIRLYQAAGDKAFLDMARSELYRDLDRCTAADDGTLQVDEGWRLMPYLEGGSAGIALVLDEYLDARPDARFEQAIGPIAAAAQPEFTAGSGLFNGRAGLIALLARIRDSGRRPAEAIQPAIERHLRRLAWHVVCYRGHAAFPGDQLMRMSMDLATGSAGVLLSLHAVRGEGVPVLPLVTRATPAAPGPDGSGRSPGRRGQDGAGIARRSLGAGGRG